LAGCMLQYALLHLAGYDSVKVCLVYRPGRGHFFPPCLE
jgi:hypothetical protein